ncbi:MAG: hypothetical protein WD766_13285, partial [Gemmatimonadota bacterium]
MADPVRYRDGASHNRTLEAGDECREREAGNGSSAVRSPREAARRALLARWRLHGEAMVVDLPLVPAEMPD